MKRDERLIPKRRFREFENNGDWEHGELGELVDIIDGDRGNHYPNGNELQERGHTIFLNASNVTATGFNFGSKQYITEEKSNIMGNGKLTLNDIVLTSRGSIGNIAWYNNLIHKQMPFARINSGMLILRCKDIIMPCFVEQFLKSPLGKKKIDLISFGSAQAQLTKKGVSNYSISFPRDTIEQRKLGVFFDNLDNLIILQQEKLKKIKNLKSAYLMEVFPKDGEKYPKLRFKGFSGTWERTKLGEILKTYPFKAYLVEPHMDGKYKVIQQGSNPVVGYSNGQPFLDYRNVVLFGDHTLSLYKPHSPFFVATDGIKIIGSKNNMDEDFLYYMLERYMIPSEGYKRYYSILKNRECITSTNQSEQQKIGNFFKTIDNLITLNQQKLEKLQNLKKAYLNEMFV